MLILASVPICSLDDGFNSFYRRRNILNNFRTKMRKRFVPAFTEQGFLKTEVPNNIYKVKLNKEAEGSP